MQGRFTVVRPLGEGGQGRVLAVTDAARDGATVALKETPGCDAGDLRREFALLARLRHPNLVVVYDWFEVSPLAPSAGPDAPAAYTQELVLGVDLWRASRGASELERDQIFEQVLRALAYLHGLGVAHLDLKPDNVIVTSLAAGPLARVLDFGIARRFDRVGRAATPDDRVRGSRSYIAPERRAGEGFDQRADLYALGVMMAEVAMGHAPAPGTLRHELCDAATRRRWLADSGLPASWLELVTGLLAPAPEDRPATAWDVAALWGRARARPVTLHTSAMAAAIVRAGPPVGRAAELAHGRAALDRGGAVVLTGPVGVGRGTLARALGREAQISGRAVEWWPHSAGTRTAAALGEAITRLVGEPRVGELLSEVDPSLDQGPSTVPGRDDGASRYAAWAEARAAALVEVLLTASTAGHGAGSPVLVVRELDAAPALARAAIRRIIAAHEAGLALPLAVIAAAERHDGPSALPLRELDRAGVEAFVASRFGPEVASSRACAALAAASGGRPSALEALATLLIDRGELAPGPTGWLWRQELAAVALPAGLDAALAERLVALPERLRWPLTALAWLRYPAPPEQVAASLDVAGSPLAELLELEAAGLVWRDAQGRAQLAHPSVAAGLGDWRPPGGEGAAHRRVVAAGGLEPLARAWHLGGEAGVRLAAELGARAWAERHLEAAAEALDLALELAGDGVAAGPALAALALRAEVADLLGPREVQVRCLERLVATLDPADPAALRARSRLFWALTRIGDVGRAEIVGRDVVARAEAAGAAGLLAEVLVHLAILLTQRGAYDDAEALLSGAADRTAPDELGLKARIANNLGNVCSYREQHAAALSHYTEAHRLKVAEGDPVGQRIAVGNMGLMCLRLGRPAEAYRHFSASLAAARRTGHRRGEAWSLCALGELGVEAGSWAYAERRLVAALAIAEELGDRVIAGDAETTLAESLLARGETGAAAARAHAGLARAEASESAYTAARARLVLASAEDGPAEVRLGEAAAVAGDALADDVTRARAERLVAELALAAGDLDRAAAAAARGVASQGRARSPSGLGTASRVARACGDASGAERLLAEAGALAAAVALSWPAAAEDDGVGDGGAIDGPSRATWLARLDVAPWVTRPTALSRPELSRSHLSRLYEVAPRASGREGRQVETNPGYRANGADRVNGGNGANGVIAAIATGERAQVERAIGAWLEATVSEHGAERAFVVVGPSTVLAARDADGEPLGDPERKLPLVAVEQARAATGVWRAAGSAGKGAIVALAVRGGVGAAAFDAVWILQNRFVGEAFEALAHRPPDVRPLGALLAAQAALAAVERLEAEMEAAEARAREVETRSTEELLTLRRELESTREQLGPTHDYPRIVFVSTRMKRMLRQVDRVVATDLPVYIHGESGTGKELVARAIHDLGARGRGPFIAQNVSAIPHTLFESELFGHERGAFTGANRTTDGLFKRASGGTLFLDEIGDLPLDLQAKLLRVLESGEVRAVGGARSVRVDTRVVSATHHDLSELVRTGRFREDLFYRLNVIRIEVPPLRERPDDIPVLAEHFLALRCGDLGRDVVLGDGVLKALVGYGWPGNVRQLENEVTRAALLADDGVITTRDLSPEVLAGGHGLRSDRIDAALGARLGLDRGLLKDRVDRLEAAVLGEAMTRCEGNKSRVARELGLSRAGLNMKLRRLGLSAGEGE